MNESKRIEFYLSSDIWRYDLSCKAKTVLAYLSYCANREGECFPSMSRIAKECAVCPNTARKGIKELADKGLIAITPRIVKAASGNRQTSNMYRLLTARAKKPKKPVQAEPPKPAEGAGDLSEEKLNALIERLGIDKSYGDASAATALELAIRELWYEENFRFKGEPVPMRRIRERLLRLDTDALDGVLIALGAYDKTDPSAYLKACLYNAPLQSSAEITSQISEYRRGHGA
ncbi:MAG: helix-turn-helix domain-containing protein [Clostridia bacterium]|nr:helix-turn-helix domain-containing protein [Clostridia bacterium]